LGQLSQDNYLKPLRDRFPVDGGFVRWLKTKVSVRTLDSRFDLDPDVYQAMWDGLPALKMDDPQVWAVVRLHWTTGVRPCESEFARTTWLEMEPESGRVLIVIKNRPEDGFTMKDDATRQSRPWPLPMDLVEMLPPLEEWAPKIWLVTHMDLHRTAKVQSFVRFLKDQVKGWGVGVS
jgi:hypothetical protein